MAFENPNVNDLAYDLRQRYAKIVGDHLEDISYARKNNNYPLYFKALIDLYVITKHKYKVNNKRQPHEKYEELKNNLIKVSNENYSAWFGKSNNSNAIAEIENALREIEMFLYKEMDKAHMFGTKDYEEGLF